MNQNPEQLARDTIDAALVRSGWVIQHKSRINLSAGLGVAIREYHTDIGPADYILFVNKKPVGVIEAKREEEGVRLTMHEEQSEGDANAKLRLLNNEALPFELSYFMIGDLAEAIKTSKPTLAPLHVWRAYEQLEKVNGQPKNELIALGSVVRTISGADTTLTSFDKAVDKNFQDLIFKKQARPTKYTTEQLQWLQMLNDYISNSLHVDRGDFELDPFNKQGGLGKMWHLFGQVTDTIIELNKRLVA